MHTRVDTQKNTVGVPAVEAFGRSFYAESVLVTILWPKQFQLNVYVLFLRREFPQGENTMQKLFLWFGFSR